MLLRAVSIGHDRRKPQAILAIDVHHDPSAQAPDSHAREPSGTLKRTRSLSCYHFWQLGWNKHRYLQLTIIVGMLKNAMAKS